MLVLAARDLSHGREARCWRSPVHGPESGGYLASRNLPQQGVPGSLGVVIWGTSRQQPLDDREVTSRFERTDHVPTIRPARRYSGTIYAHRSRGLDGGFAALKAMVACALGSPPNVVSPRLRVTSADILQELLRGEKNE